MVKHKKFLCIVLILIPYLLISGCGSKNDIPNNAAIFEDEISVDLMGRTFLIYERNAESMNKINWDYIEKKYNCKILFESPPSRTGNIDTDTASVISAVNSGNFKADAFILYPSLDFISLVSNKAIVPLDEYIDFNNEFLNDPAQNVSYFNGRYYGIAPSIVRQKNGLMYYNKSLLAREGLKDAYELQQEGQWTWENFLDIAKKATKDINGDGRIDQWGIAPVFTNQFIIKMFYSNNARFARFDENSRLTYAFDTHESLETFEFVNSLYNVHKVILYERADDNTYDSVLEDFARGKVAILGDDGFLKSEYRFIKDKFHLVFYPKGPSADDYVSSIDRENFYVVPRTASDVKASAAILRQIVANSAGYDQLMESYKSSNENDYNTLLLAGEKILYKEIQDSLINDINFGIIYPIINNSNNFDFKSYVRQKREIIQSRLDNSWNIPMNSGEWQHGS